MLSVKLTENIYEKLVFVYNVYKTLGQVSPYYTNIIPWKSLGLSKHNTDLQVS